MSNHIARDFKLLAHTIFSLNQTHKPDEPIFRRAVSTAYYAVFRLIIDEGVILLFPNDNDHELTRQIFARHFEHKTVRSTLEQLSKPVYGNKWKAYEPLFQSHKPTLVILNQAFEYLQKSRTIADYETNNKITLQQAVSVLSEMENFFLAWTSLQKDQKVLNTLVTLLFIGEVRQ